MTNSQSSMGGGQDMGVPASPSGCQPSASAADASSRSGIPNAAWTPGPWGVEHFGGSIYVGKLRSGEGRAGFDDILYATDCKDYTASAIARELANARLIAAAPELYETLSELAALMRDVVAGNYSPDSFTTQPAERALAKARGETA